MAFSLSLSLKACTNCNLYVLQRNSFFKVFHTSFGDVQFQTGALVDFRGLRMKVCRTFSIVSSAAQGRHWLGSLWDTRPVSTNRFYHTKMVILWGDFLWYLVLNFLWTEVRDCDLWNHKQHCTRSAPLYDSTMTGRISKQLCTNGMPPNGLNKNLRTWRDFWNVPDQIVTSSSEVTTADFWVMNLGTPCNSYTVCTFIISTRYSSCS